MVIFRLPSRPEEQMKVCQSFSTMNMLNFNDKNECKRIAQELSRHKQLTVSEKSFLENLIRKYGSRL